MFQIQIPKTNSFGHWELGFWIYLEIVIWDLEFETGGFSCLS